MMKYFFLILALLMAPTSYAKVSNTNELIAAMQKRYSISLFVLIRMKCSSSGGNVGCWSRFCGVCLSRTRAALGGAAPGARMQLRSIG